MKKILSIMGSLLLFVGTSKAQETTYPAPAYKGLTFITNGTVHVGNGTVLNNATIKINNGKIEAIGSNIPIPADDVKVFDAKGKDVYPGLILPQSNLGLVEISNIKSMEDFREIGEYNPNVRAISAYNADSKITNTLRSNGVLLAQTSPVGSLIGGSSSVVQLDAWNFEDAAYKNDNGIHLYFPSLLGRPTGRGGRGMQGAMPQQGDPVKEALDKIEEVKSFFRQAAMYVKQSPTNSNLKLEATRKLFSKEQKLFIHCSQVKQMLLAIDFAKEFGFSVVLIGAAESWQIADLLKQHNIGVIISQMHSLPTLDDDDIDQPYKSCAALQKAGVIFCINDDDSQNRGRNLAFNAGTAAAYGLDKEQALAAITLNAAKLLGVDATTGSLEVGKDANIIISKGDILDMKTSVVEQAFIQGRNIVLDDKHKQLYERYKYKYQLK